MFELTINGTVYSFKFGIGFVKEVSRKKQVAMEGSKEDVGLEYTIAKIQEGDIVALADVLNIANKYAGEPRITTNAIEEYLEDECTDIDKIFDDVIDFFGKSNATKRRARAMTEAMEEAQKKK